MTKKFPVIVQNSIWAFSLISTIMYALIFDIQAWVVVTGIVLSYAKANSVSIFYHRLISHRAFEVNRWINYLGCTFSSMYNDGSPLSWRASHLNHHRYTDKEFDPHSPVVTKNVLKHMFLSQNANIIHHMVSVKKTKNMDEYHLFLHRYNHYIALSFVSFLLIFFGFETAVAYYFIPVTGGSLIIGGTNLFSHMKLPFSTKPHDSKDLAHNNFFLSMILTGESWHNNHHKYPNRANFGEKWWQIDTAYYIIKLIEKK